MTWRGGRFYPWDWKAGDVIGALVGRSDRWHGAVCLCQGGASIGLAGLFFLTKGSSFQFPL